MSAIDDTTRCSWTTKDGRRCRMPRVDGHTQFCGTHLESQRKRMCSDPAAQLVNIVDGLTDLGSSAALDHALGNLLNLVLDRRIEYRRAEVLAYISQVMLQSRKMALRERAAAAHSHSAPKP